MPRLPCSASALAVAAALAPAPLLAQATPQGAAELTAVFQTYLGKVPGVVNVVADGDAYAVTLDASPLFAMIPPQAGAKAAMSPYRMRLTDNGDGTWSTSEDQPISLDISVPGLMEMNIAAGRIACEGTFDTAIKTFAESTCTVTGLDVSQVIEDPLQGRSETRQSVASMTYELTGAPGASGGADIQVDYVATDVTQVMDIPTGPGAPPMRVTLELASYEAEGTATGLRAEAVLGALAWFVANPEPGLMMANKGQMKSILTDGLPLWEHIGAGVSGSGLTVMTPVGPVSADTIEVEVELAGAVEDGLFREAIRVSGVKPPPGVVPPFLEPLLPSSAGIDFKVDGFNGAAAAQVLLGLFDLAPGASPGPEFEGRLAQAFMPDGTVTISLPAGGVSNATYDVTWEGSMVAGPGMMPSGSGKVTAKGYDAAVALVDALPDAMKGDLLAPMGMARGLAKPMPDGTLVWEIDASQPGTLKINGMDLMGMQ